MQEQGSLFTGFKPRPGLSASGDADGLRFYQREAVEHIERELRASGATLAVCATGLGKTQIFCTVAKHWPGGVLILVHREELATQAQERAEYMTDETVGREQARFHSTRERIVVGSFDSVRQPKRLKRLLSRQFSLIIVDEAHISLAKTRLQVIQDFRDAGAVLLGVTATPDRGDRRALGKLYRSVAYQADILQGIEWGYLVPLEGEMACLESVDLTSVPTVGGDFQKAALDEAMVKSVEGIVQHTLKRHPDRKGIAFFPGKLSAKLAAERFNVLSGPDTAVCITEDTPPEMRKQHIRDIKRGRYRYFVNCMVAIEGFDWPEADVVIMGRPTKSRGLYTQMAGRGARVLPGLVEHLPGAHNADARRSLIAGSNKPQATLVDFVGNCGQHSLMAPEDLLGGDYATKERQRAKEIAKKTGERDPRKNLRDARAELKRAASRYQATVNVTSRAFNPFELANSSDYGIGAPSYGAYPMSDNQRRGLEKWGYKPDEIAQLDSRGASRLLGQCAKRAKGGKASVNQMRWLRKAGVHGEVSFAAAKSALDYIASKRWDLTQVNPFVLQDLAKGKP